MNPHTQDKFKWLTIALLWVYILLRANRLSITNDEAYSFHLVATNYLKAMAGTANTHWLNSLAIKIGSLFGYAPLALRWASVLLWPLYGISAMRISRHARLPAVGMLLFALLVLNPFLIDFFSLARGYALMCAFSLAALYYILKATQAETLQSRNWWHAFSFAALGVFANFTALYFLLALACLFVFYLLQRRQWGFLFPIKSKLKWWLLIGGTIIFAVANLLFIKLYTGDLEFGGDNLVASVGGSLVAGTLYGKANDRAIILLSYGLLALLVPAILFAAAVFFRKRKLTPLVLFAAISGGMLLLNILFHLLFKTPYLYSRTTLILYPFFSGTLCFAWDELPMIYSRWIKTVVSSLAAIVVAAHFYSELNLRYCYEFKNQTDLKDAMNELLQHQPKNVMVQNWFTGVLINYYKTADPEKYNFAFVPVTSARLQAPDSVILRQAAQCDHALVAGPVDTAAFGAQKIRFDVIRQYPLTGALVARIKKQP